MTDLQALAADFAYAAGPGAARVASSTVRAGKEKAETDVALGTPGPALQSILARHGGTARASGPASLVSPTLVADRMAEIAVDEGAAVLLGHR